jgi:alginate O-acetyltransferase complex protein AlgI
MVFSNPWYFVFLAVVLLAIAPPFSVSTKKKVLAVASCLFYAAWDYRYLALLLFISVVDYACAARIAEVVPSKRRRWLLFSLVSNLGLLGYFKYTNFFIENLNGLGPVLGIHIPHQDILLPAGISFYTFKTMSYVIDVYRGELRPVRTLWDYVTFVTFFPELIAGPIVRASVLLPQMDRPIGPNPDRLALGASMFLLGFTKKMIADRFGAMVTPVFDRPWTFASSTLWAVMLAYALQIYCDFSGYSDMAIGSAKMIGYDLPENFRMPYLSADITEFWRRWHMTLSQWLRDYLYIPLGGNRRGSTRTYVNLLLTMTLGGLWHGASWNFVVWGGLHGLALAAHRFRRGRGGFEVPRPIAVLGTFLFVAVAWIPFRAQTFGQSRAFVAGLFSAQSGLSWIAPDFGWLVALVACGHFVGALASNPAGAGRQRLEAFLANIDARIVVHSASGSYVRLGTGTVLGAYAVATWVLFAFLFAVTDTSPFIYFQF